MVRQCVDLSASSFIRLNPSNIVKKFSCGDDDLDDFILRRASAFQKHLLSVSYAYVDDVSGRILAYCSLANDKVAITDFKDKAEFNRFRKKRGFPNEKRLKSYPAVKLCRLGVDMTAKGQRIGTTILNYIKSMFVIENKTGCRFLTVDAYLNAVPFYEKNGFRFMTQDDDDPHTRLMYFDLLDIV
ncbi:GNAT family N-acetyltransferase [uncultured Fibrobacter sp.]|uniref:GNAT family N-acetyltransferase n=1 Tax=uncultured Fibrobacter sp. TaxID=261512 RepID=UPI001566E1CB|nr:GNAT family N-acetyltransferase [uncultured Fibrobacter sp.]